jgi:hypothetical protein
VMPGGGYHQIAVPGTFHYMNKHALRGLLIIFPIVAISWFFYPVASGLAPVSDRRVAALAPRPQPISEGKLADAMPWFGLPSEYRLTGKQAVAAKPPHVVARQKKMNLLGYGSPPIYYDMNLKTLIALAKKGDGDAMLQLAEQYSEEARFLTADPDYPKGEDLNLLAKQYLADAVNAGYSRAAAILAKKNFEENNPVDAYAWKMMSEKIGDGNNAVWGKETNQFAGLTDEQKKLAKAKFESILNMAMATRLRALHEAQGQAQRR